MATLQLLGNTELEETKHIPLICTWDWHAKPFSHLFEEIFRNESTTHSILSMRLKPQPIKFLDAYFITLDNANHFLKHFWFRISMISIVALCIELFILIVIGSWLELLKCAFGPFLCIHSLLSSIILFALSVIVDVVDVSSENSVDQLSTSSVLSRCLRTKIIADNFKFIIVWAVVYSLKLVSLACNSIPIVGSFI